MVWSDEFDYSGLPDSTKWNYDTEGNDAGWGNNEAQYYTEANEKNACRKWGFKYHWLIRKNLREKNILQQGWFQKPNGNMAKLK